jgi:hypothetical protein
MSSSPTSSNRSWKRVAINGLLQPCPTAPLDCTLAAFPERAYPLRSRRLWLLARSVGSTKPANSLTGCVRSSTKGCFCVASPAGTQPFRTHSSSRPQPKWASSARACRARYSCATGRVKSSRLPAFPRVFPPAPGMRNSPSSFSPPIPCSFVPTGSLTPAMRTTRIRPWRASGCLPAALQRRAARPARPRIFRDPGVHQGLSPMGRYDRRGVPLLGQVARPGSLGKQASPVHFPIDPFALLA